MSDLDELFDQVPIGDIADALGVSKPEAKTAVAAALPALLHGLQANASDPRGADSLAAALATKDTALIDGGISLADVDVKDGEKIVSHIFGANTDGVATQLGGLGGVGGKDVMAKILPILAPIVLSFIAKQMMGSSAESSSPSSGGLGDILGQVLGGMASGSGSSSSGGGMGDILGQVLGDAMSGSSGSSSTGGLGDLLGGLLGGGTK